MFLQRPVRGLRYLPAGQSVCADAVDVTFTQLPVAGLIVFPVSQV